DTAHGFLAWGVATLFTAALLTSVTAAIVTGGVKAGASMVTGAVSTTGKVVDAADSIDSTNAERALNYFVDSLFRQSNTTGQNTQTQPQSIPPEAAPVDGAEPAAESFPATTQPAQVATQSTPRSNDL